MRWLAVSFAILLALEAATAGAQDAMALAQRRFDAGRTAFDEGRFEDALAEFRASYELSPSPNSRLFAARCLRELGRAAEARDEFLLAAREAADRSASEPRFLPTEQAAIDEGAALEGLVGHVVVEVARGDVIELVIAGRRLPAAAIGQAIAVDPGSLEIVVRTRDGDGHAAIEARAGAEQRVVITPTLRTGRAPPTPPSPPIRRSVLAPLGWSGFVLAALSGGVFAGFFVAADDRYANLRAACVSRCGSEMSGAIEEGRTFETVANAAFVAMIALSASGALLLSIAALDTGNVDLAMGPVSAHVRLRF